MHGMCVLYVWLNYYLTFVYLQQVSEEERPLPPTLSSLLFFPRRPQVSIACFVLINYLLKSNRLIYMFFGLFLITIYIVDKCQVKYIQNLIFC